MSFGRDDEKHLRLFGWKKRGLAFAHAKNKRRKNYLNFTRTKKKKLNLVYGRTLDEMVGDAEKGA